MELRSKKRLLNTRQLPGYTDGKIQINPIPWISGLEEGPFADNIYYREFKLDADPNIKPMNIYLPDKKLRKMLSSPEGNNSNLKKTGQTILENLGDVATTGALMYKGMQYAGPMSNEILSGSTKSENTYDGINYKHEYFSDDYLKNEAEHNDRLLESNLRETTLSGLQTGAKIGGAIGGPVGGILGGAAGGLLGYGVGTISGIKNSIKYQQEVMRAKDALAFKNKVAESEAEDQAVRQNYYRKYGNYTNQSLIGAEKGKDAGIYIKPSKRGTFTAAAKARGMGVQEFASKVLANKDNYSTAMVKKANFARNASKWADGKDEGYYSNPYKSIFDVYTSEGLQKGQPNSKVAKGETILDNINSTQEATGSLVRRGKEGVDTELANLGENTIVLGGQLDWRTGISFKDQAKPYTQALEHINKKFEGRGSKYGGVLANNTSKLQQEQVNKLKQPIVEKLQDLAQQQQYQHQVEGYNEQYMVKRGKDKRYPGFASGKPSAWDSIIPNSIGLLAAIDQYRDAASQDVYKPNTYARNTYAGMALPTLAGIRLNGQEIQNQLQDQARWANYGIEQSGGLTGGQKLNAKLANYANLRKQSADSAMKLQETNNKYLSNWAENALRYGAVDAENRLKANQFDEEMFANAHAAKLQGKQMGMLNFMKFLEQLSADNAKRKQFNSMYNLYVQDQKIDKDKLNAYIENMQQNRQINSNQVWNPFYKPSQMELLLNTLMRSLKAPTVKYIKK